ncbi:hypothetical protein RN001_015138 [Aquatica leii]|uniref:Uncharacterized protein n=1 Tax=Aquatica leii TaxID=1421715 RepID=A0AAN7PP98_9COLE|nr:hypothetical protein RN001_015138 [Aquatica leii]
MMMKAVLIVLAIVALANGTPFVCDRSKRYEENKCNQCSCIVRNDKLSFRCTKMSCLVPEYTTLRNCDPTSYVSSNNCWCIPDWGVMCEMALISQIVGAFGASTTIFTTVSDATSSETSCHEGECTSIRNCLSNDGVIQDSSLCTCPDVYCCYSTLATESSSSESTPSTESTFSSSIASSEQTSSTSSSETSTLSSVKESSPSSEIATNVYTHSDEKLVTATFPNIESTSESESDCTPWVCLEKDECDNLGGTEVTDTQSCPKPYTKCCFSSD